MPALKYHSCGLPPLHVQVGEMYSAVASRFTCRVEAGHVTLPVHSNASFVHCFVQASRHNLLPIRRHLNKDILQNFAIGQVAAQIFHDCAEPVSQCPIVGFIEQS